MSVAPSLLHVVPCPLVVAPSAALEPVALPSCPEGESSPSASLPLCRRPSCWGHPLLTGCVQFSSGMAPHTKMAAKRALLSLRIQLLLLLCLQHVRASVHCLVAMLSTCLEGLVDMLSHTRMLVYGFVGLCHHLDLGGVAVCRHVPPLQLHGGRLGHHIG